MTESMESLTKTEAKLLIDNALLEQEKRLSKEFRDELDTQTTKLIDAVEKQNKLYSEQIINLNKDVATLNTVVSALKGRISNVKSQITVIGASCTVLGGFFGFLAAQFLR